MITIDYPYRYTRMEIWQPRYSSAYDTDTKERVALLAKYKIDKATHVIIIEFTKAKHLAGQRFAIRRSAVQACPLDTNGKIPCYAVPMSLLDNWQTEAELADMVYSDYEEGATL